MAAPLSQPCTEQRRPKRVDRLRRRRRGRRSPPQAGARYPGPGAAEVGLSAAAAPLLSPWGPLKVKDSLAA